MTWVATLRFLFRQKWTNNYDDVEWHPLDFVLDLGSPNIWRANVRNENFSKWRCSSGDTHRSASSNIINKSVLYIIGRRNASDRHSEQSKPNHSCFHVMPLSMHFIDGKPPSSRWKEKHNNVKRKVNRLHRCAFLSRIVVCARFCVIAKLTYINSVRNGIMIR